MNLNESVDDLPIDENTVFLIAEDGLSSQALFNPTEQTIKRYSVGYRRVTEAEWRQWQDERTTTA